MEVISVKHLHKSFFLSISKRSGFLGALSTLFSRERQEIHAVNDISFSINMGDIIGFIGPNGAGKSTTIKILTGILTPTSGEVEVCSISPHKQRLKNAMNIGAVFGQRTQLWWDLPVIESLNLLQRIYEIDDRTYQNKLKEFIDLLSLDEFINRPVRQLSLGQRMRADLAAAFLHSPKVVFLDEPTIGLDITAKRKMREFIKMLNSLYNTTIILTTHDMQDIEELSSRVMIINHGKMILDDTISSLRQRYAGNRTVNFKLAEPVSSIDIERFAAEYTMMIRDEMISVQIPVNISPAEVFAFIDSKYKILDMQLIDTTVEDIIEKAYTL
ncbi:hypothetical protein AK95_03290 [Paenibacillus sp. LC231]|uniref:ABC transporter ATP-binding protein n=1 Tax=unclassified Paenibacillus TaxID=185978 RepID=UPI0008DC8190|nr:ATP-binding cassette domain-containing protein [Paenibacillus sp. LC231]OIB01940.1 hypothetical protein AK95_03290 [Paenibacillus sp. LC231]